MLGLSTNVLEAWASFFANHAAVRTVIVFLHIGGLVVSGGTAISADRMTLIAVHRGSETRISQLQALRSTHRIVLLGLTVVIISGLLQFASDVQTFFHSRIFWTKMGLLSLLLVNGSMLVRAERQAGRGDERGWTRLRATSISSITLWLLTTLAGAALPNI